MVRINGWAVGEQVSDRLELSNPTVGISAIEKRKYELAALIDTGSPVSFIKCSAFGKFVEPTAVKVEPSTRRLRDLDNNALKILGVVRTTIAIREMGDHTLPMNLYVFYGNSFEGDIILGREFLRDQRLVLEYKIFDSRDGEPDASVNLFSFLPLCISDGESERELKQMIAMHEIDFGKEDRDKLTDLILDIADRKIEPIEDNYAVPVRLKDTSVYAYAPRRFAFAERIQIREITDDLLKRGIIQLSISPYCARVIPVRKKSGKLRLCVDLRPLNARVEKQKFPFLHVEECLSRLANKTVFTLLDLKDSFHQIKVADGYTKYFAFATPDGQFEYKRLPFGYSESPAEFQKRLLQILSPLVRENKILVYIDDVLIPSETVDGNLAILKEVLILLKAYRFELNYEKCQFLKRKIEFLGYVISARGITLSPAHTIAVREYKQPRNVHEVRRFRGLASYFRKFIWDFAIKAGPIQSLLKKHKEFVFDENCESAFRLLKKELTSSPVLALYNPLAETEVHTDASCEGLGAILVQKQIDKRWRPVAYFSKPRTRQRKVTIATS